MLIAWVVGCCLLLLLLSVPQRDWLVRRMALAQAALFDLRRAMRLPDYTWMVREGVPQLEQVCSVLGASRDDALLPALRFQAETLHPCIAAYLRQCRDVAALLDTVAPVEPLRAGELRRPWLRCAARVDAWGRQALAPRHHLRMHLALLDWGLRWTLGRLREAHPPQRAARYVRLAQQGADVGTLARASAYAGAVLLRSPAVLLHETPAAGTPGPRLM